MSMSENNKFSNGKIKTQSSLSFRYRNVQYFYSYLGFRTQSDQMGRYYQSSAICLSNNTFFK